MFKKGKKITGLKNFEESSDIALFHAGTRFENNEYYTNGGRVLSVCASERMLTDPVTMPAAIFPVVRKISVLILNILIYILLGLFLHMN